MVILEVYENATQPCSFVIEMESRHGCGCEPKCGNKNCGPDGCGGYCGSEGHDGMCPSGYYCTDDQTCTWGMHSPLPDGLTPSSPLAPPAGPPG